MKSGPAGGVTRVSGRRRLRARCDLGCQGRRVRQGLLLASGNHHPTPGDVARRATITPHPRPMAAQAPGDVSGPLENIPETDPAFLLWAYRAGRKPRGLQDWGMPPHDDETKDARRRICIHNRFFCTRGRQRANQGYGQSAAVASAGEARRSRHCGQGIIRPPVYAGSS
jgi:hypothetical protein